MVLFFKESGRFISIKNTFFCKKRIQQMLYNVNQVNLKNQFTMKRNFVSHISCEKNIKKTKKEVKSNVEALVETCYLNTLREMIEERSAKECNGCICSYEEKVDLLYKSSVAKLMDCNDDVIKKFNACISTLESNIYPLNDVINAENMLKCSVHRDKICIDNFVYFKEELLLIKC